MDWICSNRESFIFSAETDVIGSAESDDARSITREQPQRLMSGITIEETIRETFPNRNTEQKNNMKMSLLWSHRHYRKKVSQKFWACQDGLEGPESHDPNLQKVALVSPETQLRHIGIFT